MTRLKISQSSYDTIDGWGSDKPVVSLMGEFSAGKSTLLNFILDKDVATTQVTATALPAIWFCYSDKEFTKGLRHDGRVEDVDLSRKDIDFRNEYLILRCGLTNEALKNVHLIDAPGNSDPDLHKDALRFLSRFHDFVIWCTSASQAWRQSEKTAYLKLSKATQQNSLLIITRFDKLRNSKDQQKVLKRVTSEVDGLFSSVLGLQTTKAYAVAQDERTSTSDSAWVKTGGAAFWDAFSQSVIAVHADKVSKTRSSKAQKTRNVHENSASQESRVKTETDPIQALEEIKSIPGNSQYCRQLDHLIATIACQILPKVPENTALGECIRIFGNDLEPERLVSQLEREIREFSNSDSVRLDIR